MPALIQTHIAENRGKPRLWVEGERLAREGIQPGMVFSFRIVDGRIVLKPAADDANGDDIVRVSSRTRRGKVRPLLEICRQELVSLFGIATRVVLRMVKGAISITRHHLDENIERRNQNFLSRLKSGKALRITSLYHGGGVMDDAVHTGLESQGVESYCKIASEIEGKYLDSSISNNPHLFRDDSLILNAPVEQLSFASSGIETEGLIGGVPCTGASLSGRAKNGIQFAEQHDSAGAQFYAFLRMIEVNNPAFCILENVTQYRTTASYAVICSVLGSRGYTIHEMDLNGCEFGSLENRNRMCMIAISQGLEGFGIEQIVPLMTKPDMLARVLEPFESVADRWKDCKGLREKEVRDKAAGKGFMRQILRPEVDKVPTITRGYNKIRSTDPQLQHPTDPLLTRLFTPQEHARIKGIPERIVDGQSDTTAHEILGQSVIHPAFRAVGSALGKWMKGLVEPADVATESSLIPA